MKNHSKMSGFLFIKLSRQQLAQWLIQKQLRYSLNKAVISKLGSHQ